MKITLEAGLIFSSRWCILIKEFFFSSEPFNQMEADFGDGDVIESDIKDCESLVQLGFHLLAEMAISSSPEVTSDMIKPVFELATVHFLKLADVEKINAQLVGNGAK